MSMNRVRVEVASVAITAPGRWKEKDAMRKYVKPNRTKERANVIRFI